jgi:hypothetical protein
MSASAPNHDPAQTTRGSAWPDALLGMLIMLAAAVGAWSLAARVPKSALDPRNADIYFSSDTSRVHANMTSRDSNHWRTSVHPLFSIGLHPPFRGVAALMGADLSGGPLSPAALAVGRVMSGIAAGLAAGAFFALLRAALIRRLDAVIFCLLAGCSAFALFWFSVPETYPWGAVTILCALLLAAAGCHRQLPAGWYVAASVLSLSVTTTNWMAGLLATFTRFVTDKAALFSFAAWRKVAVYSGVALALTLAFAVAQKVIFPSSSLFIRIGGEKAYVMQQHSGGPLRCWASLFSHTVIMPEVTTAPHVRVAGQTVLRTQLSAPASASRSTQQPSAIFPQLLAGGVYALISLPDLVPLRVTLGLTLLGQLGLHTIYGAETFLYAAHYGPLMIALAALATRTRLRPAVLLLAVIMTACLLLNNFPQFDRTMDLLAKSQHRLDQLPQPVP